MTAVLCLLLLSTPQPVSLRYTYEVGQEWRYLLTKQFENRELDERTTQHEELVYRVESIDQAGIATISVRRRLIGLVLDGQDIPITVAEQWLTLTEQRNPRGFVREREPHPHEPTANGRLLRLFDWNYPVTPIRVGANWSSGLSPEEDLRIPGLDWAFRLEAASETEVRVRATFVEQVAEGLSGTGFAILDRRTGWPIRITLTVRNVVVPGDELRTPMVGSFELAYQPQKTTNAEPGS